LCFKACVFLDIGIRFNVSADSFYPLRVPRMTACGTVEERRLGAP
jgi:hypothetical protein